MKFHLPGEIRLQDLMKNAILTITVLARKAAVAAAAVAVVAAAAVVATRDN
ncbi:MAG: hypothetical protein RL463_857 [Bacteroidota bacterium]